MRGVAAEERHRPMKQPGLVRTRRRSPVLQAYERGLRRSVPLRILISSR
jgi:hypothetical protein